MRISAPIPDPITIEGDPAEDVNEFTYLGSVISTDNRAQKYIKNRIIKQEEFLVDSEPFGSPNS